MGTDTEQTYVMGPPDTVRSDPVTTTDAEDPTIVRESRPVDPTAGEAPPNGATPVQADAPVATDATDITGTPVVNKTPVETEAPSTYAERQVIMRRRYGGMHLGADFLGFTVAVFFLELFLAIDAGVGYYFLHAQVPTIGGVIPMSFVALGLGGLGAVFLAYLLGGYAAGRMARFDGAANGFGVWVWTILAGIILGLIGWGIGYLFNAGSAIHLRAGTETVAATLVALAVVSLAVALLGAILGGALGGSYHRRIDREAEAL